MQRAEAAGGDNDVAFVCLWIVFNAAYVQDATGGRDNASERQTFRDFVGQVCQFDADKALAALAWQVFPGPIRVLLDNQYVFQPFWDALNNPNSDGSIPQYWREAFEHLFVLPPRRPERHVPRVVKNRAPKFPTKKCQSGLN